MMFRPKVSLRDVLLQYERLWSADGETYERAVHQMWEALRVATRDDAVAAHLGAQFDPREFPRSGLILSSPTVRDALERCNAFYNAANPHVTQTMERRSAGTVLSVRHRRLTSAFRRDTILRLSILAHLVRWFDPHKRAPLAVRLRAPRPLHDAQLRAAFGCALEYCQAEDAVVVATEALDTRIWGSKLVAQRIGDLSAMPADVPLRPETLIERVAAAIRCGLPVGRSGKKHVAPEFGVSPRSLERWLAKASVSYREILEDVRQERCLQLLRVDGLAQNELAALLGFSTFANFRRALCRWFAPEARVPAAGSGAPRGDDVGAGRSCAPPPDAPSEPSRAGVSAAHPARSAADRWIAEYGPRPCPFASRTCERDCTIHPATFQTQSAPGLP
jgi:AraC-like DNA-binding protein